MNRRDLLLASASALMCARPALAATPQLRVFKTPTCGCCSAWVTHMTEAGFAVEATDIDHGALAQIKRRAGLTPELSSCHTAFVAGYVVEGHVPASDVQRLLSSRPDALGLTVPGMPIGSPGMEMGNEREAYDTILVLKDGTAQVFQSHQ